WFYDFPSYGYSIGYYGHGYNVHARNERLSAYAQDSWKVTPRLTVNPGVRIDLNRGYVRTGKVYSSNPIAPPPGFAWDLAGDGKTLVKAHYGRYYEALFADYYYWVEPGAFEGGEIRAVFPDGTSEPIADIPGGKYALDPNLRHPYLDQVI